MSNSWTPTTFMKDTSLELKPVKIPEMPIFMSIIDANETGEPLYMIYRNMHPAYIAVRSGGPVLLGHTHDSHATELMKLQLKPEYERVGWTRNAKECMLDEGDGRIMFMNSYAAEVKTLADFVGPMLRASTEDDLTIKSITNGDDGPVLRVNPMLRLTPLVVLALEGLGMSAISINTASELHAIFSLGLLYAIDEGFVHEHGTLASLQLVTNKIDGSSTGIMRRMVKGVAEAMEIEVVE